MKTSRHPLTKLLGAGMHSSKTSLVAGQGRGILHVTARCLHTDYVHPSISAWQTCNVSVPLKLHAFVTVLTCVTAGSYPGGNNFADAPYTYRVVGCVSSETEFGANRTRLTPSQSTFAAATAVAATKSSRYMGVMRMPSTGAMAVFSFDEMPLTRCLS